MNNYTFHREQFKNLLIELWFETYSRGNRILGSCGFEHVFMGEKKNGAVQEELEMDFFITFGTLHPLQRGKPMHK